MNKHSFTKLAAGIAAISLATSPAAFAQGKGNGGDKGNGGGKSAQVKGKDKGGNAKRGNAEKRGGSKQAKQSDRGDTNRNAVNNQTADRGNQKKNGNAERSQRAKSNDRNDVNRTAIRQTDNSGKGNGAKASKIQTNGDRGNGNQRVRVRSRDGRDLDVGFALPQLRQTLVRDTRVINGCPPGLAKKRNGCLPPGQAKKGYRSYNPGYFGLSGIGSGQYFYDDGYLLSYRSDGIAGYLPLLGGALGIGNIWPTNYAAAPLPDYYNSYYGLDNPRGYRFADNVVYRVDPETAAIVSVAALLTGDDVSIGRPLPSGYDVYNVPYAYRDQYTDGPRARYRYVDGYIYEVDPESALVVAAIDLVA